MSELEKLSDFSPELALQAAGPILTNLVSNREFLDLQVLPHLGQSGWTREWYVAHRHDGADGSYSVQVFVWPPGSATRIHDHSCWGAFCCAVGSLVEERYERLDDGSEPNSAHLREVWRLVWRREDGVSSVLPYEGGHPPGRKPKQRDSYLRAPLRSKIGEAGRPGLRPLPRLRLRSTRDLRLLLLGLGILKSLGSSAQTDTRPAAHKPRREPRGGGIRRAF